MAEAPRTETSGSNRSPKPVRLASLDAYRGFIMTMLAANGFGILAFSRISSDSPIWQSHDYEWWQKLAVQFEHPSWVSLIGTFGVAFWDLIQPAFMFMVGVSMPFSYGRRTLMGQSDTSRLFHALWRAVVLVLLGVFLNSMRHPRTDWAFPNVLAQIGLGYFFVWLLLQRTLVVQFVSLVLLLLGNWLMFFVNTPPPNYNYAAVHADVDKGEVFQGRFAPWSKNANTAFLFDQWLLPKLRTVPNTEAAADADPDLRGVSGDTAPDVTPADTASPASDAAVAQDATQAAVVQDATQAAVVQDATQAPVVQDASEAAVAADASNNTPDASATSKSVEPETKSSWTETVVPAPEAQPPSLLWRWFFSNPDPYEPNRGGYTTLNFIPSMGTMLIGVMVGQLLLAAGLTPAKKLGILIIAAAVCVAAGVGLHHVACPIVKRIWTPSWVLFSAGYVIGMLALFYLMFDFLPLRRLAFPLVVVGMNSILIYMMGQLIRGWTAENVLRTHLSGLIESLWGPRALDPQWYGPVTEATGVFILFWLFLYWLYRQRIFLRI